VNSLLGIHSLVGSLKGGFSEELSGRFDPFLHSIFLTNITSSKILNFLGFFL
jgi:hypothetical protein